MGVTRGAAATLPVCVFTRNRTRCAMATAEALLSNLSCSGRAIRYVLCDDRSEPGHVDAVLSVFRNRGVEPSVHLCDGSRHGLGASMNNGLRDAFSDSDLCLRIEDDWILKRPLDVGPWCDAMGPMRIGSLRLGMMFRKPSELVPSECGLLRVASEPHRTYTFNNQVAIVSRDLWRMLGPYVENVHPQRTERDMAVRYNALTLKGSRPPYVMWPEGWETMSHHGPNMAFDHAGVSTLGHRNPIPGMYSSINDPKADEDARRRFLAG